MNESAGILLLKSFLHAKRNLDRAKDHGNLTQGEYLVLRRIKIERMLDDPLFKTLLISNHLDIPASAVSRILNTLEERKLIVRSINDANRRSVLVDLTKEGLDALALAERNINTFASNLVNHLGKEKAIELTNLLNEASTFFDIQAKEKENA